MSTHSTKKWWTQGSLLYLRTISGRGVTKKQIHLHISIFFQRHLSRWSEHSTVHLYTHNMIPFSMIGFVSHQKRNNMKNSHQKSSTVNSNFLPKKIVRTIFSFTDCSLSPISLLFLLQLWNSINFPAKGIKLFSTHEIPAGCPLWQN